IHGLRSGEVRLSEDHAGCVLAEQTFFAARSPLLDDIALALANTLHIDANIACPDAIILRPIREIRDAAAGDHRFRWRAANVHTGPAEMLALDQHCLLARRGERGRERT